MADLTQTVTNSVNVFGGGGTSLWAAYNWNAFKWGEGTVPFVFQVTHLLAETLSPTSARSAADATHLVQDSYSGLDSVIIREAGPTISESLAPTSDMTSETLQDAAGFFYVFDSNTTNHENQAIASFTSGSSPSGTWVSASASSSAWS